MTKELKFRYWDEETNKFGSGQLLSPANKKITQYIGIKDKNGKEIYEGDYCKFTFKTKTFNELNSDFLNETFGTITYSIEKSCYILTDIKYRWSNPPSMVFEHLGFFQNDEIEIIGNIFEGHKA